MKGDIGSILHEEQERYIESLLPARDPVTAEIEDYARSHQVPIIDPEVGYFLYITARALEARFILEVGTAIGYSSLWLARALPPNGRLVSIDVDSNSQCKAREFWTAAQVADRVDTRLGAALEILPQLTGPFDMLFIDTGKINEYRRYVDLAVPLLRPNALILADNALWQGNLARGKHDENTDAMRDFNQFALTHPRLLATVLPLGDGLLYAVVRGVEARTE
jgi:predicted O-methyltransferase YrrM